MYQHEESSEMMPLPTGGMSSASSKSTMESTSNPFASGDDNTGARQSQFVSNQPPSGASYFSMQGITKVLQEHFNVTTFEVARRLGISFFPFRHLKGDPAFASQPDMYGPFWIAATAIVFMTGAGNAETIWKSTTETAYADYSLTWSAACLLYGVLLAIPALTHAFAWFMGLPSATMDAYRYIVCVYGYSNSALVPVSLLCVLPHAYLQNLFVTLGVCVSCTFAVANLWTTLYELPGRLRLCIVGLAVAGQVLTYTIYRVYFLA